MPLIETRAAMLLVDCHLASHSSRWLKPMSEHHHNKSSVDRQVFLNLVSIRSSNSNFNINRTSRPWRSCQREEITIIIIPRTICKIKKNQRMLITLLIQFRMHPKASSASARRTAATTKDLTTRSRRTKRSKAKYQIKSARLAKSAWTPSEAACCLEHRSR